MSVPVFMWNESLAKTIPHPLVFSYKITAAKTVVPHVQGLQSAVLSTFDAIASQSVIDTFLGTTNEFLVAQFDATSMGTDAFGCIVNMKGQGAQAAYMNIRVYSGANLATEVTVAASGGSLASSTLETAYALGSQGNLAFKSVLSGVDALTSGIIECRLFWVAK